MFFLFVCLDLDSIACSWYMHIYVTYVNAFVIVFKLLLKENKKLKLSHWVF
jgi:hypothetical protein